MKNIKDLKEDILNNTAGNLFVFNGEEWAVKKHYINKIAEGYNKVRYIDNTSELSDAVATRSLFKKKTLYVVSHDLDFLELSAKEYDNIIKRVLESKDGAIWVYSAKIPKTFLTHFDNYITEFDVVEEDIFEQLVLHEISLMPDHISTLAKNCNRNYGMALMEIDKIKNYAQYENVSNDVAFEDLYLCGILNVEKDKFDCKEFMNNLLAQNYRGLGHSLKCLYDNNFENAWYHLEEIITDFKIVYCFVKYGKRDGASRAFESEHLYWGRVKEIRDCVLSWDEHNWNKCTTPWEPEDLQWIIMKLSGYDADVKQGKMTNKEVIENIFYYLV